MQRLELTHAVGIALAVTAGVAAALVLSLATASAQPNPGTTATPNPPATAVTICTCGWRPHFRRWSLEINRERPAAGKTFRGLTFRKLGSAGTISWVVCKATIAGKSVPAQEQSFYAGPHQRNKVICGWRIPADARGKRLRLLTYVLHIWPHSVAATGNADDLSWRVRP